MSFNRRTFLRTGSSLAALVYAKSLCAVEKSAVAGVVVTPDQIRQEIEGFGFSEAFHAARTIQLLAPSDQVALLDLMFSPSSGMGYSILRNEIGEGPLGAGTRDGTVASIEPAPGEFNWTGDEDQIWLMNEAKKRGCLRFMSTAWSPPAWMKTNSSNYDGELKLAMYQQYADYLATYVLEYKKRYDIDIYAISPANEPGYIPSIKYASSRWSASQWVKFLKGNLIPTFKAKGVAAKIIIDEHNNWTDSGINAILADPVCDAYIQIVAAHAYAATDLPYMDIGLRTGRFKTAIEKKKSIWQTEVSVDDPNITNIDDGVYWARVIHTAMVEDNVSAWLYWWGAAQTSTRGALVDIDPKTNKYQISKRLFTIGHFARFIRPGYHRVDANPTPAPHTYFSAYLDPTGKRLICIAINDDAVECPLSIQCGGFKGTTCEVVRTSATETHARLKSVTATNGAFEVVTAPLSVTTFIIT